MARKHQMTTISEEDKQFLKENDVILSQFLAEKIQEFKESKGKEDFYTIHELQKSIKALQGIVSKLKAFIIKKGLALEWEKEA
jgi:hypothetical protein